MQERIEQAFAWIGEAQNEIRKIEYRPETADSDEDSRRGFNKHVAELASWLFWKEDYADVLHRLQNLRKHNKMRDNGPDERDLLSKEPKEGDLGTDDIVSN